MSLSLYICLSVGWNKNFSLLPWQITPSNSVRILESNNPFLTTLLIFILVPRDRIPTACQVPWTRNRKVEKKKKKKRKEKSIYIYIYILFFLHFKILNFFFLKFFEFFFLPFPRCRGNNGETAPHGPPEGSNLLYCIDICKHLKKSHFNGIPPF
jgi:hypothetical protein